MAIPYVGQRKTAQEFRQYLDSLQFTTFNPTFVTLHHTAAPSLAQRQKGFEPQHLLNLRDYYQNTLGWSGAPHLFIDDQQDGIIVFQRMDRRGVHAVSFNSKSWGVEMLGYYDIEPFDSGRGAVVRDNAMRALAIMCERLGVDADTIKFHRDDPKTKKTCPGTLVKKQDVISRVHTLMGGAPIADHAEDFTEWELVLSTGAKWPEVRTKDGRPIVRARDFLVALKAGSTIAPMPGNKIRWDIGQPVTLAVAELDEQNRSWVFLRDACNACAANIKIVGRVITLS
jgi:hypothetical protein